MSGEAVPGRALVLTSNLDRARALGSVFLERGETIDLVLAPHDFE
jgi:hypothetical protein